MQLFATRLGQTRGGSAPPKSRQGLHGQAGKHLMGGSSVSSGCGNKRGECGVAGAVACTWAVAAAAAAAIGAARAVEAPSLALPGGGTVTPTLLDQNPNFGRMHSSICASLEWLRGAALLSPGRALEMCCHMSDRSHHY